MCGCHLRLCCPEGIACCVSLAMARTPPLADILAGSDRGYPEMRLWRRLSTGPAISPAIASPSLFPTPPK
jgi:hypothetical protein